MSIPRNWRLQQQRYRLVGEKCEKCGEVVNHNDVIGLALCLECNEDCLAYMEGKNLAGDDAWVYLALCPRPDHEEGNCVGERETTALTEYFNSRI